MSHPVPPGIRPPSTAPCYPVGVQQRRSWPSCRAKPRAIPSKKVRGGLGGGRERSPLKHRSNNISDAGSLLCLSACGLQAVLRMLVRPPLQILIEACERELKSFAAHGPYRHPKRTTMGSQSLSAELKFGLKQAYTLRLPPSLPSLPPCLPLCLSLSLSLSLPLSLSCSSSVYVYMYIDIYIHTHMCAYIRACIYTYRPCIEPCTPAASNTESRSCFLFDA